MSDDPTSTSACSPELRRRIRSFAIRSGRMTAGQQLAMDKAWPVFGLRVEAGLIDPAAVFGRSAPLVLEIGFGMGGSLAQMMLDSPQTDFIGVEVHRPGLGSILMKTLEQGSTNLRLYGQDANDVINQCLPEACLDRVQLFFPDPWHKKKHHKRRLVQAEFVQRLRARIKIGGVFHLATDWENYAEHMMDVLSGAEGFRNATGERQYAPRPEYRPVTKFERRGERLGHGVWDLLFERVS